MAGHAYTFFFILLARTALSSHPFVLDVPHGRSEKASLSLLSSGGLLSRLATQRQQFGRGQVIRRGEEEGQLVWAAGSDLRGDGHASPL